MGTGRKVYAHLFSTTEDVTPLACISTEKSAAMWIARRNPTRRKNDIFRFEVSEKTYGAILETEKMSYERRGMAPFVARELRPDSYWMAMPSGARREIEKTVSPIFLV